MKSESDNERGLQQVKTSTSDVWSELSGASDPRRFASAWLERQASYLGTDALQGVVVHGTPDTGPFAPLAVWPEGTIGSSALVSAIESAIQKSATVTIGGRRKTDDSDRKLKTDAIACPLIVDGQVFGAVAFEVGHKTAEELDDIAASMKWGTGWLELLVRRRKSSLADRLVAVIELSATALQHDRFQGAATAVATELASELLCERVSISFLKGKHAKVAAISHSAAFGKKANIVRAIEAAMDEAIDQQATIRFPRSDDEGPLQVTRSHEKLVTEHGSGAICTVPLAQGERLLGAITLERPADQPFDSAAVEQCEHVAALLGPLLEVKRRDDRLLIGKAADSARENTRKLFGPRHVLMKVLTSAAVLLLLFFAFATGEFRVTADARLEGEVQRAIATPIAGYVSDANVRAGDLVKKGDIMFALDDRELRLERVKWGSQKAQYSREYAEATALYDRAKASVLAAQIEQAEANISLVDEQLERLKGLAPFDGVVVSGDLSQSLGAPLERGDVLFEVAPLNAYRLILKVEERDIAAVQIGQTGQLVLTGMPTEKIPIVISKVTPVATAEEGLNYFRVDARLGDDASLELLRPGMEGVGKITVDERKLIWIWTYKIRYWFRMLFWSWLP